MNKATVFPSIRTFVTYLILKLLVARLIGRRLSKLGVTYFKVGRGIFKKLIFFCHFVFLNNAK